MKSPSRPLRVGYFGYRGWSWALLETLLKHFQGTSVTFPLIGTVPYTDEHIEYTPNPAIQIFDPKDASALVALIREARLDVALFYGWSWMVPIEATTAIDCVCLHPSLLPCYRGGCPLQHQILNNEQHSGLTLFRMNTVLDGGDILAQQKFSLKGTLADIFQRIIQHGTATTITLLVDYQQQRVHYTPQPDLDQFPPYRRRKPAESELRLEQLPTLSTQYLYNFVRALDTPYPNCFITLAGNDKLVIQEVSPTSIPPADGIAFDGTLSSVNSRTYLTLADGYARLVRFNTVKASPII